MAKRKVYKFKTWIKIIVFLSIVLIIGSIVGYNYYKDYQYKESNEYKFLQIRGSTDKEKYSEEEIKMFLNKLTKDEQKDLINRGYNEFYPYFISREYFIYSNLDLYMENVITKEKDFFKYHGTDGYDYDKLIGIVNSHANEEPYKSDRVSDESKGYAMIANKHYQVGDYAPTDLIAIPWKYRYGDQNTKIELREAAYNAYISMWEAANQDGHYLLALSGYRSKKEQEKDYNYYRTRNGEKYADKIAARPGWSEHQTGLALDIYSKENGDNATFHQSEAYKWLVENSYKYGFILRYPKGYEAITGYQYESWHYRYLGVELAKQVHDSGLTYDEYYAYYLDK